MRAEPEFDAVITRRRTVADAVVELAISPVDGEAPKWQPGSHLDLVLGEGLVRQYSLCGDPEDRNGLTVAVLREPDGRGGSAWVHDRLAVGDTVRVRGPRNHFELREAQRYVFVAGGIGITPLLPMIVAAERAGVPWKLTYGGRSRASMAYLDELAALAGPGALSICPQDEVGLLDLEAAIGAPEAGTLIYCCGPEPLLVAIEQQCAGWPSGSLHLERFSPKAAAETGPGTGFVVECSVSGLAVDVAAGTSILAAVQAAGVSVLSSCQEGTCGTCETVVLDGEPDHRDSVLSPQEQASNEVMMICCSRSRSARLVLEL